MKTLAELITSVKGRIAIEMDQPEVMDLSDDAIARIAVESVPEVMKRLSAEDMQALIVPDSPLTMTGESADLPTDYFLMKTVKTLSGRVAIFYPDFINYNMFDGQSLLMSPTEDTPISTVADNKVYVNPTQTEISLTYIKVHPPLTDQQGTLLSTSGDKMLEDAVVSKYFAHVKDYNRAAQEAGAVQ